MKLKIVLLLIIVLAFVLRFLYIGMIPAGIHQDEESHGYNAYSLIKTGKDRYGQPYPILFRSFGSYQPPVYTYLATIPVGIFGNSIEAVRSISVLAGVLLVLVTYLLCVQLFTEGKRQLIALIASLVVAISPWSVYFSRLVAEGNIGVLFFITSILLFVLSLKRVWVFIIATLVLALSTHAYYSERIISIIFLPAFLILYKDYFLQHKRVVILGLITFSTVMLPHVFILTTGALTRRLDEVGYIGGTNSYLGEFIKRYLIYFSPRNLFFDLGSDLGRMPPMLGVFYVTFLLPFFLGIKNIKKLLIPKFFKLLILLIVITPISAAMTGDSYYPLRALDLIWIFSIIISVGIFSILQHFTRVVGIFLLILIVTHSLFSLYVSYFVLFKYEKAKNYGNVYLSLYEKLDNYKDYNIIVDSQRDSGAGLRLAYFKYYNPLDLQKQLRDRLESPYYSKKVKLYEEYDIYNIKFKPIDWSETNSCVNTLLVGDVLSISAQQAKDHKLKKEFEVRDISGREEMTGYSLDNSENCKLNSN